MQRRFVLQKEVLSRRNLNLTLKFTTFAQYSNMAVFVTTFANQHKKDALFWF